MPSPPITVEITTGSCKILVRGKRSAKGWVILQSPGGAHEPIRLDQRKHKDEAIQYAQDACKPGTQATFIIQPNQSGQ
jgi:hypothetical protein